MSASDDKPAVKVGTAKNGGKAKKLTASQAAKKGDGAKLVTHLCSNCGASEGNLRCLDCGVERYCGKACQKVRGDAAGKPCRPHLHSRSDPSYRATLYPGALEMRRPQEGLQGLRPRCHRSGAARPAV